MVKIYESPVLVSRSKTVLPPSGDRICIEKPDYPDWHMTELEISEVVDYANEGNKSTIRN